MQNKKQAVSFVEFESHSEVLTSIFRQCSLPSSITFVTAEQGGGKTCLAEHLHTLYEADSAVVTYKEAIDSFENFLSGVAEYCGCSFEQLRQDRDLTPVIDCCIETFQAQKRKLIVICDQAHLIYLATFERILRFQKKFKDHGLAIHLLFLGEEPVRELFDRLVGGKESKVDGLLLTLKPLSKEDCSRFFSEILREKNLDTKKLSDNFWKQLFRLTRGNMKEIKKIAEKADENSSSEASFFSLLSEIEDEPTTEEKEKSIKEAIAARRKSDAKRPYVIAGFCLFTVSLIGCGTFYFLKSIDGNSEYESTVKTDFPPAKEAVVKEEVTPAKKNLEVKPVDKLSKDVAKQVEKTVKPVVEEVSKKAAEVNKVVEQVKVAEVKKVQEKVESTLSTTAALVEVKPQPPQEVVKTPEVKKQIATEPEKLTTPELVSTALPAKTPAVKKETVAVKAVKEQVEIKSEPVKIAEPAEQSASKLISSFSDKVQAGGGKTKTLAVATVAQSEADVVKDPGVPIITKGENDRKIVSGQNSSVSEVQQLYKSRQQATASWLAKRDKDFFTLQLMALESEKAEIHLQDFFAKEAAKDEVTNLYILKKVRLPAKTYVFYGEYESKEVAKKAQENLPEFLKSYNPYLLSIDAALNKADL